MKLPALIADHLDAANYQRGRTVMLADGTTISNNANPAAFADVTGLTMAVVVGSYQFEAELWYTTAATTTGIAAAMNGPTTSVLSYTVLQNGATATALQWQVLTSYNSGSATANVTSGTGFIRIKGCATFTAAGTLAVRFKSEVDGSQVNILEGSFLRVYG